MILTALKRGISPAYKGVGEGGAILLDTIPFVKRVVCPTLSSLPMELLSSREKNDLAHTVHVMSDLNIGYIHLKAPDGTYQYKLEPDLELITTFTGLFVINMLHNEWIFYHNSLHLFKNHRCPVSSNEQLEQTVDCARS